MTSIYKNRFWVYLFLMICAFSGHAQQTVNNTENTQQNNRQYAEVSEYNELIIFRRYLLELQTLVQHERFEKNEGEILLLPSELKQRVEQWYQQYKEILKNYYFPIIGEYYKYERSAFLRILSSEPNLNLYNRSFVIEVINYMIKRTDEEIQRATALDKAVEDSIIQHVSSMYAGIDFAKSKKSRKTYVQDLICLRSGKSSTRLHPFIGALLLSHYTYICKANIIDAKIWCNYYPYSTEQGEQLIEKAINCRQLISKIISPSHANIPAHLEQCELMLEYSQYSNKSIEENKPVYIEFPYRFGTYRIPPGKINIQYE